MKVTILQSKQPQIIKLHSIDRSYRAVLSHKFSLAAQSLSILKVFPLKFIKTHQTLFTLLNHAIYNYLTLLHIRKTFGEQYTYLNLYNPDDYQYTGTPLSRQNRLLLFFLNTFSFPILKFLFKKLYTELLEDCKSEHGGKAWRVLISFFPEFDELVEKVEKLVLMLFLIRGDYFNLQERLLKVKYIYLRHFKETKIGYKKEGYLMLAQNVVELVGVLWGVYKVVSVERRREEVYGKGLAEVQGREGEKEEGQEESCVICSEAITNRSVTACGHMFCWGCIVKSTEYKEQCPTCRKKCLPSQVIQLRNY